MKSRVYLETSIISYLTARPSRDLITAANQQVTHEWWDTRREEFDVFVSQTVILEARGGDPDAARRRLQVLDGLPLLDVDKAAQDLASVLIIGGAVPLRATQDALHIALAASNSMDYLLTWNFAHIANAAMRSTIDDLCRGQGYEPPVICSPQQLLEA